MLRSGTRSLLWDRVPALFSSSLRPAMTFAEFFCRIEELKTFTEFLPFVLKCHSMGSQRLLMSTEPARLPWTPRARLFLANWGGFEVKAKGRIQLTWRWGSVLPLFSPILHHCWRVIRVTPPEWQHGPKMDRRYYVYIKNNRNLPSRSQSEQRIKAPAVPVACE